MQTPIKKRAGILFCCLILSTGTIMATGPEAEMNEIAEAYVKLVLSLGHHDDGYIDAYYGPEAWRQDAAKLTLKEIRAKVRQLRQRLVPIKPGSQELDQLRHKYLDKQLIAVDAFAAFKQGEKMNFDEEARLLYDTEPPHYDEAHFQAILAKLETLLPGEGPVHVRLNHFRQQFVIPPAKLDAVFKAAVAEGRKRTGRFMDLPQGETFQIEYVTDKPWSGYNWYKGNATSLIQVNTELPIYIDRAIDLACHEGYPGHHVYNAMLEKALVKGKGWLEFSVYPLFSPQSLIAEGSANFGIQVAFPAEERVRFEQEVLFPLAGLDPKQADRYYQVMGLLDDSKYAGNEAARAYLNGTMTKEEAISWLEKYALMTPDRAAQRLRFIETYRSYVINYNWGQDLVRDYVNAKGGSEDQPEKRWQIFAGLLASPRLPSGLN